MLPTFVIGLREGLEAALIVGIIAAFLRNQGRMDLLRWVFAGVATATLLCVGVGVALEVLSKNLPQRQQEGLETVVGALAVAMVTYMVVWMRRHSRELKGALEGAAAAALDGGASRAGRAMVLMAFLAVLREGFETVVFLLAAFNESGSGASAGIGAALGIVVAVGLGYGIYRGGVSLNLSKFFRATGLVLVFVAGGLVVTALHTAHEANWLTIGQGSTVNLTWLVRPGSVQASLLTGMLGVQAHPVVIEVIGWLVYVIPVGVYVAWPPGRSIAPRRLAITAGLSGALAGVAALVVTLVAPSAPGRPAATSGGGVSIQALSLTSAGLRVRASVNNNTPAPDPTLRRGAAAVVKGLNAVRYDGTVPHLLGAPVRAMLSPAAVAKLNGGRLPLGLGTGTHGRIPVTYSSTTRLSITVEPTTLRVVGGRITVSEFATADGAVGSIPLPTPVASTVHVVPAAADATAVAAARADLSRINQHRDSSDAALGLGVVAAILVGLAGGLEVAARRRRTSVVDTPTASLVGHQVSLT